MKSSVFTYHDELIKICVKNQIKKDDASIEAEVIVDDEDKYQVCKKNGIVVPLANGCIIDKSLLSLIGKCL